MVESRKEAKAHVWKRPSFQAKGAPALVLGENGVLTLLDESPAHADEEEVVESLQLEEAGGVGAVQEGEEGGGVESLELDDEQRQAAAALTIQSHQRGVRDRKAVESRKEAKAHIWTRPSFQAKGAPALQLGADGVLTLLDESPAHEDQEVVELDAAQALEEAEAAGHEEVTLQEVGEAVGAGANPGVEADAPASTEVGADAPRVAEAGGPEVGAVASQEAGVVGWRAGGAMTRDEACTLNPAP